MSAYNLHLHVVNGKSFTSQKRKMANIVSEIGCKWLMIAGQAIDRAEETTSMEIDNASQLIIIYFPQQQNREIIALENIIEHEHIQPDVVVIHLRNNPGYCKLQFRFPSLSTLNNFLANINRPSSDSGKSSP